MGEILLGFLNKEDLIVNETLIWQQDKAQAAYRHKLKKTGATSTQVPVHGKNMSMYKANKDQVFPSLDKVFLSLKAAWREDQSKFPSLKEYHAVSLLVPSFKEEWSECHMTFAVGRFFT